MSKDVDGLLRCFSVIQGKVKKVSHRKTLHLGNLGEILVAMDTGLILLPGTTTSGPDAVAIPGRSAPELHPGRYQIKYRDSQTSDVTFRIDLMKDKDAIHRHYAWDYLLIAAHDGGLKHRDYYVVPIEEAVRMGEPLGGGIRETQGRQRRYCMLRIGWTWKRGTGAQRENIEKTFSLKPQRNERTLWLAKDSPSPARRRRELA